MTDKEEKRCWCGRIHDPTIPFGSPEWWKDIGESET